MSQQAERRKHTRISFDADLCISSSTLEIHPELLDISFRGMLVRISPEQKLDADQELEATLTLDDHQTEIHMRVYPRHREGELQGLECSRLDPESWSMLRRLVELNLGDADLLNRELVALSSHSPR